MKIVLAGATGFLGSALVSALTRAGHDLVVLSRRVRPTPPHGLKTRTVQWNPEAEPGPWAAEIDAAAVVINLAGEPLAERRWTPAHKARIQRSRVAATSALTDAIAGATVPPHVLINASAVGVYGPCGSEIVTEQHPAGDDFLAHVCRDWEAAAMAAASPRTRVVCVRTGLVLARDGGALASLLPPFRFGVGGPLGSGRQYWPWIHRDDWVALVMFALEHDDIGGAMNATGPAPVTNREFSRALGRALRRPALLPAPAFALRILLGEMADSLLLAGQRAVPEVALRSGFRFEYETAEKAIESLTN